MAGETHIFVLYESSGIDHVQDCIQYRGAFRFGFQLPNVESLQRVQNSAGLSHDFKVERPLTPRANDGDNHANLRHWLQGFPWVGNHLVLKSIGVGPKAVD